MVGGEGYSVYEQERDTAVEVGGVGGSMSCQHHFEFNDLGCALVSLLFLYKNYRGG